MKGRFVNNAVLTKKGRGTAAAKRAAKKRKKAKKK